MPARIASAGEWNASALAVDHDLAFVGLVQAVELAHQGALARAVFAEQGVDLARAHVEADPIVGQDAREALDDIAHLDAGDASLDLWTVALMAWDSPCRGWKLGLGTGD